jgi:hypothetical protein
MDFRAQTKIEAIVALYVTHLRQNKQGKEKDKGRKKILFTLGKRRFHSPILLEFRPLPSTYLPRDRTSNLEGFGHRTFSYGRCSPKATANGNTSFW